jgi:tRNA nucleotidyltransferase (CCA-adding enzyme)
MQVITTHVNADLDCLASMVAAQKLYPDAVLVFPGALERATQDYLHKTSLSVRITRPRDVDPEAVRHVILVDTQDPARTGMFETLLNKPGVEVHVYDHHTDAERKIAASLSVVEKRGAATTLLFEKLQEKSIGLSATEATLLALGIFQDTHSLTSISTTPEDFHALGRLIALGADLNTVVQYVTPRLNAEQIAVMNQLILNLEMLNVNGVDVAIATASVEYYVEDLSILLHKIMELENLNVLLVLVLLGRRVYLIGRSRSEAVNVREILQPFGGGGHAVAASASVAEMTLLQVRSKLFSILQDKVRPPSLVRDVMHCPVVSVVETDTIKAVEKILTRCNLNAVPVTAANRPVGLLTRQTVEKAIHHKLGDEPASEFMVREFSVTNPESGFKTIIPLIIEDKQRIVPVVAPGTGDLVGVVSRGDVLRFLYSDMVAFAGVDVSALDPSARPLKNVKSLMKDRLPRGILPLFERIIGTADRTGVLVYVVGGFVRDLLMGNENGGENLDIDIVVEGDGIAFAKELGLELEGRVRSHAKFGTSVVVLPGGFKLDVATARMEYYKHPAALPTVEMSSVKSDLFRRDFTFNSMAVKLNGQNPWGLIDFFNGQKDLKEKSVRVLHNLSIVEDPCRAFRAVRFEQRFAFKIGRQTEAFIKSAVRRRLFDRLSGKRLFSELAQILKEKNPLNCILRMRELGLWQFVHPEALKNPAVTATLKRVVNALAWARMAPFPHEPEVWLIHLLGLLYFLDDIEMNEAMGRLEMPMRIRNRIKLDRSACRHCLQTLGKPGSDPTPAEIYDAFSQLSPEGVLFLIAVADSERINRFALTYVSQFQTAAQTALSGDDLIRLGMQPGPGFKAVLKALREARLNGEIKTREEEEAFVRKKFL